MLWDIAEADYGMQAEEMFPLLGALRDTGKIPAPMPAQLIEVLELTRWCNPDEPNRPPFQPGPSGARRHHTRLFACAVLMRASVEPFFGYTGINEDATLAQCIASAIALGEELSEASACFLTWQLAAPQGDLERLFIGLGLLLLATRLRTERFTDSALGDVAEWVLTEEAGDPQTMQWNPADEKPIAFSLYEERWQPLAIWLKAEAATIEAQDIREDLQLCAILLETGWNR